MSIESENTVRYAKLPVERDEGFLDRTVLELINLVRDGGSCVDDLNISELQVCRGMPVPLPYADLVQLGPVSDGSFYDEATKEVYIAKENANEIWGLGTNDDASVAAGGGGGGQAVAVSMRKSRKKSQKIRKSK